MITKTISITLLLSNRLGTGTVRVQTVAKLNAKVAGDTLLKGKQPCAGTFINLFFHAAETDLGHV